MRNTKRRIEALSFYNHTDIARHLEKMASKGWMIEKIANTGWVYHRIEPKQTHFSVSYYPKASEFDPEPSEEQKMFHDFCAHTGWKLACTSAQMQVFYNELENPIPIETEPELELAAIHASAKKSFIPSYALLLVIALMNGGLWVSNLLGDPLDLLSTPSKLFTGFAFFLLSLLCVVELFCYFKWYKKAKVAAKRGEFLEGISTSKFQNTILGIVLVMALIWFISNVFSSDSLKRWVTIIMCFYMPVLFMIVNGTKQLLKRKKVSRGINRTLTIITSFVGAFALTGIIVWGLLTATFKGVFADANEETYEHRGTTWVIHQDELPLVVEELMEVEYNGYIKERRGNESLILGQLVMRQYPRFDTENYIDIPQLEYTMTIVKISALYDFCKERLIYEQEELHAFGDLIYQKEDAKVWGANEVYRLYDPEYGARNDYLLCYENLIVEISFSWEPTSEQMAIVGEKLNIQ